MEDCYLTEGVEKTLVALSNMRENDRRSASITEFYNSICGV